MDEFSRDYTVSSKNTTTIEHQASINNITSSYNSYFWSDRTAWLEVGWQFLLSRFGILLVTMVGVSRFWSTNFPEQGMSAPVECASNLYTCFISWWHWDTVHYINIATYGYTRDMETAFFPLWPLLIKGFGWIMGGSLVANYTAAIILSNILFLITLYLFYKLIQEDFSLEVAKRATFYFAFAPYTLFFFVGYAESIFMPLVIVFFLALRRRWWWRAGLCGLLACLSRPTSIVLCIPLLVYALQYFGWRQIFSWTKFGEKATIIFATALIPLGLALYMAYLYLTKGNPLVFAAQQAVEWQRYTTFPFMGIFYAVQALFTPGSLFEINLTNLIFTLLPIGALILGWKRIPLHYALFALALILFSLSQPYMKVDPVLDIIKDPLKAAPRYMLVVFPAFIIYAIWGKHERVHQLFTALFLIYFTYVTILFITNNWAA